MKINVAFFKWIQVASTVALLPFLVANPASAYNPEETILPTALELRLSLKTEAPSKQFFSDVVFTNTAGEEQAVRIYFTFIQTTTNILTGIQEYNYIGNATEISYIQQFAAPNMRSYWDDMRFKTSAYIRRPGKDGVYTDIDLWPLNIGKLEMWIFYEMPAAWNKFTHIKIASETDPTPIAGYIDLDNDAGRKEYVQEILGWTDAEYDGLSEPIKMAIGDLGKTGSSDATDWPDPSYENPQYGFDEPSGGYCGEFVSWYYYEDGYTLDVTPIVTADGDNFYDFLMPRAEFDFTIDHWYQEAGLKYNYYYDYSNANDPYNGKFYLEKPDGSLDFSAPVQPMPGDYFGLFEQHATLLLYWDEASQTPYFIDGPASISVGAFDLENWITNEPVANAGNYHHPFIGRYTPNDAMPIPGCSEDTAVDMGAPGNVVTVPNNGCIMVDSGYPDWWDVRVMQIQSGAGSAVTVPYYWTNDCESSSGSGEFTGDWQSEYFGPTSEQCPTVIDLRGDGSGTIDLAYYG